MKTPLKLIAMVVLLVTIQSSLMALPNPYRIVDGWAKLPEGRSMGAVGDVTMDQDPAKVCKGATVK